MKHLLATTETKPWMLVDDNVSVLELMSALVENLTDATIECFNSPQAALSAFATAPEKYEVVITDFEMPGMDGVELCRGCWNSLQNKKSFWQPAADSLRRRRRSTRVSAGC